MIIYCNNEFLLESYKKNGYKIIGKNNKDGNIEWVLKKLPTKGGDKNEKK